MGDTVKDDIRFLKDLQNDLKTQGNDGQAPPRYWSIMDYKWIPTAEGHEDRVTLYDSDNCETLSLDGRSERDCSIKIGWRQ
ncbi:hypothetical protein VQL36_14610 [Chengkuizengella sp. SCS-71B]|uniref:hypothetical protein n=1 Tax=Chengkuizengella sp. SCS-71B TaxID=3115290 RepID=UPI0032C243E0